MVGLSEEALDALDVETEGALVLALQTGVGFVNLVGEGAVGLASDDAALVGLGVYDTGWLHDDHLAGDLREALGSGVGIDNGGPHVIDKLFVGQIRRLLIAEEQDTRNSPIDAKDDSLAHKRMLAHAALDRQREDLLAIVQGDTVVETGEVLPDIGQGRVRLEDVLGVPRARLWVVRVVCRETRVALEVDALKGAVAEGLHVDGLADVLVDANVVPGVVSFITAHGVAEQTSFGTVLRQVRYGSLAVNGGKTDKEHSRSKHNTNVHTLCYQTVAKLIRRPRATGRHEARSPESLDTPLALADQAQGIGHNVDGLGPRRLNGRDQVRRGKGKRGAEKVGRDAHVHGLQGDGQAVHVVQGESAKVLEPGALHRMRKDVLVGEEDGLGKTGGTGAVHDESRLVGLDLTIKDSLEGSLIDGARLAVVGTGRYGDQVEGHIIGDDSLESLVDLLCGTVGDGVGLGLVEQVLDSQGGQSEGKTHDSVAQPTEGKEGHDKVDIRGRIDANNLLTILHIKGQSTFTTPTLEIQGKESSRTGFNPALM